MNEHADQLRHAFESHEYLAPDAASVRAGVAERAATYRRRRVAGQATGGVILSAGLVAGAVALPNVLPSGPAKDVTVSAASAPTPSPTPSLTPEQIDAAMDAYFAAGYDLAEAHELAKIWKSTGLIGTVKVEAGQKLLAGETLPVAAPVQEVQPAAEKKAIAAFFDAGYDFADAKALAKLWKSKDTYQTKVDAGQKLLDGETLPIQP